MKLPKKIKIGPSWFEFYRHDPNTELNGVLGQFDPQRSVISIMKDGFRNDGQTKEALFHELLHAGFYLAQMAPIPAAEEDAVSRLSMAMTTIFVDNPKLKEALF